jgi:propionyl-CoA carboxylase alpha chain
VLGPITNVAFLLDLIEHPAFIAAETHTGFLAQHFSRWQPQGKVHTLEAALAAALNRSRRGRVEARTTQFGPESPWQRLGEWRIGV